MRTSRLLPPFLAGATLVLLGANALPTSLRKKRLIEKTAVLRQELRHEEERRERLEAEIAALRNDPFYIERVFVETWRTTPAGARRLEIAPEPPPDADLSPYEE